MKNVLKIMFFPMCLLIAQSSYAVSYNGYTAGNYAVKNYNKSYGSGWNRNPFINVHGVGGNCTNFANQSVSAGFVRTTSAHDLNKKFLSNAYPIKNITNKYRKYKCNRVGDRCQTATWRGVQNFFNYSRSSYQQKYGTKMKLVTKTRLRNGSIDKLDVSKIRKGDIIFIDFKYNIGSSNPVDHATIVTKVSKTRWWDFTRHRKYNRVRLTYQSSNRTNRGLGDVLYSKTSNVNGAVAYVYRPSV